MGDDWYRIANEAEIPSPALLVYPNRIVHNLHRMVEIAGMPARLRPHEDSQVARADRRVIPGD